MAITPGKFRGPASIQPVGAGKAQAQRPNATGSSKKSGHLLRDLEMNKLEGDPLTLLGNGTEPTIPGDTPDIDGISSIGDRLIFWDSSTAGAQRGKVAIGVDSDKTLWFEASTTTAGNDEESGFDWYSVGASSSTLARRMRLTSAGKLILGAGDPTAFASVQLTIDGATSESVASVAGGPTATSAKYTICNATPGSFTMTLPAAADAEGVRLGFIRINGGANTVTIDADGAETIDGALTKRLDTQYACIEIVSDGTSWNIFSQKGTVT